MEIYKLIQFCGVHVAYTENFHVIIFSPFFELILFDLDFWHFKKIFISAFSANFITTFSYLSVYLIVIICNEIICFLVSCNFAPYFELSDYLISPFKSYHSGVYLRNSLASARKHTSLITVLILNYSRDRNHLLWQIWLWLKNLLNWLRCKMRNISILVNHRKSHLNILCILESVIQLLQKLVFISNSFHGIHFTHFHELLNFCLKISYESCLIGRLLFGLLLFFLIFLMAFEIHLSLFRHEFFWKFLQYIWSRFFFFLITKRKVKVSEQFKYLIICKCLFLFFLSLFLVKVLLLLINLILWVFS
jgi:hypothetical protein